MKTETNSLYSNNSFNDSNSDKRYLGWNNNKSTPKETNVKEKTLDLFRALKEFEGKENVTRQTESIRNQIIVMNKELVLHIINKEYAKRVPAGVIQDLYQEGMLGMIKAISRFEVERNVAFSTYAVIWIRQFVNTYLLTQTYSIKTPSNLVTLYHKIRKATEELRLKFGREPEIKEIATLIEKPSKMIELAIHAVNTQATSSLDETHSQDSGGESGVSMYNSLDTSEAGPSVGGFNEMNIDSSRNFEFFKESFDTLPKREKMLLMIRYGIVSTVDEYNAVFDTKNSEAV